LFAGNFLGDNAQSIVGNAAGSAFFMNQGGIVVTLASAPSTISAGEPYPERAPGAYGRHCHHAYASLTVVIQ
jgi:hypothetical protein